MGRAVLGRAVLITADPGAELGRSNASVRDKMKQERDSRSNSNKVRKTWTTEEKRSASLLYKSCHFLKKVQFLHVVTKPHPITANIPPVPRAELGIKGVIYYGSL